MSIMRVDDGVILLGFRIRLRPLWAALFIGKFGFVIIGKGEGK